MPSWKKVITSGSDASLNSLYAPHITGSLLGTASYAIYAETASYSNRTLQTDVLVLNQSGNNIAKGVVVRITGSNNASDIPRVVTASYENDNNSANTLGVTTQLIANGAEGYVVTEGVLTGVNTSAFTSGQLLYLGPTGSIIGTAPVAPLHSVRLGEVIREQTNNGSIYVRIDNGYEIGELHDVRDTTTSTSYGDLLIKSASVWTNSKQLSGSYGVTGSFSVQDSIDSSNKWLIGLGAMPGTTSTAVDWNSRVLYDTTGTTTSIDWQTRTLANSTGINNVDWENRYLYGPGPIPTSTEVAVDWNARQLSNSNGNIILDWGDSSPQFSGTASFATSASWAPGGGASFPYTGSAEITGSLGVTGSFSVLDSIDATNKILIGSGLVPGSTANSVNWDSRTLFDTNGNFSVRWGALRTMYDANVSASIDWNNRQLKDANGIDIVNWQSGISITGSNIITGSVEVTGSFKVQDSIDSSNKWLIGPGSIPGSTATAVAWSDRQLLNSSGTTIVDWETGVFTGTATSASFAATASFINPLNQSMVITGSLRGQVSALSILSNTASVDMVTNNFFTLTLANGASTNINPTNINPGQTVNILVTQGSAGTGTVTFPSLVKQASGSLYTGSAVANAVDIVTMIAFDATNVYVSSIRNMI